MTATWTQNLALGIDALDDQHREIFLHVADLNASVLDGRGPGVAMMLIDFLERYVAEHFGDEEKLMTEHEYPAIEAHKAEHVRFRVTFEEVRAEYVTGPTPELVARLSDLTADWLSHHIGGTDRAFARYLKSRFGG